MNKHKKSDSIEKAKEIFRKNGGLLRTRQAIAFGIHPRVLYVMRDQRIIDMINRGLFRLKETMPPGEIDLMAVASRVPNGVVCLISALSFHGLTTQIPHEIYIALRKGMRRPKIDYPPVKPFWFSEPAYSKGIEMKKIKSINIRIYNVEKTLADCFKFRKKIGVDIAVEALRTWQKKRGSDIKKLLYYAKICRVDKVISPYLEALI